MRYKFPKDTSASILTSGLLGETYVGLEAGGDDKSLQAGDRITITQSAVVLEKLIGQFLFSKAQETSPAPSAAAAPAKSAAAPAKK
jgi:phospholipid/cholesterol/gamma-HCH transport system substrate-binding protein